MGEGGRGGLEASARGGLEGKAYPWGDDLTPEGRHRGNIWQGDFPHWDSGADGFTSVAPADSFQPNGYGLYNSVGNVWEFCSDYFDAAWHKDATRFNPAGPPSGQTRVIKGGSYLCHQSYCNRYRNAARTGVEQDASTGHMGFRVARDF